MLLLITALIPAFGIQLFTGFEQRHRAIKKAENDVQLLTRSMVQTQQDLINTCRSILSTIALLPEVQSFDLVTSEKIFTALIAQNPEFQNFTLTDLSGEVLASALPFDQINLSDRKHFREAVTRNDFAVGEFIISRVGIAEPALAFAYPVRGSAGKVQGVLTAAVNLSRFFALQSVPQLSEQSFIAITDHQGVRLFYAPIRTDTNPIGQPILPESWEKTRNATGNRIFVGTGSDGRQRVVAFEPISLHPGNSAYAYVWAGIPQDEILKPANRTLARNLALLFAALIATLVMAWRIGHMSLVKPIKQLVELTHDLAAGIRPERPSLTAVPAEIVTLNGAFFHMATTLESNRMALATEKEQLAVTLNSIGDAVITTDTRGRVVLMNPIAEELTGWTIKDAVDRPLTEVFHIINELTGETCESPVEKVLASGQIVGLANHTALISRNGEKRSIADSGAPIVTSTGETIGVVLVFRDVTDQYRLERELEKARKIESLGLLAGGIAHDFNNMLSAILGNINLCLLHPNLDEKTRKRLQNAFKASERARDLTRQLLTFAKGGQLIRKTAKLPEIIEDSTEFILHGSDVKCRYHVADDLHPVDIDTTQISQVVQNLILNAIQAMPAGGIVDVSCTNVDTDEIADKPLDQSKGYVRMTISDQGIGIAADIIDNIFDPYFSTKSQGNGLGLAIVHSIISKHDGHIEVGSRPGQGTCFHVYLPTAPAKAAESEDPSGQSHSGSLQGKVLVMDDEEPVRRIICEMLEECGLESIEAVDGREAVHIYQQHLNTPPPIGLAIMDLTIPGGMGGKEAALEILTIDPKARIIVISGYSQDPIMARYRDYGLCAVLAKPFSIDELKNVLNMGRKEASE